MPRLSKTRQLYWSEWECPKCRVWRHQAVLKAPRPMIHYLFGGCVRERGRKIDRGWEEVSE